MDYRAVAACVREVSDGAIPLIEKLAAAVADELAARFPGAASACASRDRACRPRCGVLRRYRSARELICSVYRLERTPFAGNTSRYA